MKDLNFFRKLYKFYGIGIFSEEPLEKKNFYFTHRHKSRIKIELCVLDLA
jgi:hypothetical protein